MDEKKIEFENLTIVCSLQADGTLYQFIGDVDENFRHQQVTLPKKPGIFLNLAEVRHFNSVGIREWIHLITRFSYISPPHFRECSVSVIDQINMIPDTLGDGIVESFYAPYYCKCGQELNKLITVSDFQNDLLQKEAPPFTCACGQDLEFDAIEESYFQFFNLYPKVG